MIYVNNYTIIIEPEDVIDNLLKKLENMPASDKKINEIYLDNQEEQTDFYSDFIYSAVVLKSKCYSIVEMPRNKIEKMAFNIKLNLPITNSIIVGLLCLEIYKLCQVNFLFQFFITL